MKKTAIGFLMMACMGFIRNANAAYVIKLKNGNEYVTNRYWQAGGQILFDTYGGSLGIDRSFVGKIEQSDRNCHCQLIRPRLKGPETRRTADTNQGRIP